MDSTYTPPSTRTIKSSQNDDTSLRFLLAQRRMYSRSKTWLGLRLIGLGLIGLAAPVLTLAKPDLSVAVGAIAGLWIFLSRSLFYDQERKGCIRAAYVQEQFDTHIFNITDLADRAVKVSPEQITKLAGLDTDIQAQAKKENLLDWYAINDGDSGTTTVAICQRTNVAYAGGLLKVTSIVWLSLIIFWAVGLIIASVILNLTLAEFILGIFLPLLPAFLDNFAYKRSIDRACSDREAMSHEIKNKLEGNDVSSGDLLVWQARIYELRCDAPQVPDFVYKITRRANERTMKSVARQLSDRDRRQP